MFSKYTKVTSLFLSQERYRGKEREDGGGNERDREGQRERVGGEKE